MKRYPKYKDSGVEWIGEIPNNWKVLKIKRLTSIKRGASPRPIDDPKYFDENGEFSWVRIADVTASERYLKQTTQTLSELGSSLSVKRYPGDFFVSIAGSVGKPIITKIKCCIHDGFVWFPYLNINSEFLYYMFSAGELYKGLGKWGTQLNLNTETIGDIHIPLPLDSEIENIVNYLDNKTDQIDTLIDKKQKQIELLKEQRTAIINHAVTKGLNPDVKMKDSGIEWLGEIPVHWTLLPLRRGIEFLTDFESNGSFSSLKDNVNVNTEDPYAWYVRATDLENKRYGNVEGNHFCDKSTYDFLKKTTLYGGELLITKRGEIGKLYLMPKIELPATLAPNLYLIRLDAKRLYPRFTFHWFSSNFGNPQLVLANKSTTIGALYKNDIKDCLCLFPPLKEQKSIANYLDEETLKITNSILKYETQIEYIKEYRTALISDAVTGKIDVRNEVPQ